jgi:SpoVK/Ycf46/Vps4 family AAA+-type ATPase
MLDVGGMMQIDTDYNYFWGVQRYGQEALTLQPKELQEIDYICMTPFVYGFSFRTKVWGEMVAEKVLPVEFRKESFEQLVLDPGIKKLVRTLVASDSQGKDFIDGKGGGCIFLLEGEPGCGKTFTAEATAESLERPLHAVTVGELGTTADDLDHRLRMILEIAARWNAVLLLDECDIFLEARSSNDIQRNAMVGVFLRLLEYYPGIMFLTTNRSEQLDPAVYSRISLPIHYPNLDENGLRQVWKNHLQLNGVDHQDWELDRLATRAVLQKVNGRQIKNCVRQACALASYESRATTVADVVYLLGALERFATKNGEISL